MHSDHVFHSPPLFQSKYKQLMVANYSLPTSLYTALKITFDNMKLTNIRLWTSSSYKLSSIVLYYCITVCQVSGLVARAEES